MAGRILSVRERCITAVQMRLLEIQEDSGYNFSVTGVYRKDGAHTAARLPPEIFLFIGTEREGPLTGGTEDRLNKLLSIEIRAFTEAAKDIDREFNLMLSDIERCLPNEKLFSLVDPFYPHGHIRLRPGPNRPVYSNAERGQVFGQINYQVIYWCMASDPRLWSSDDRHVYEDEFTVPD